MTSIGWTSADDDTVGSHVYTFRAQATQGATALPSPELLARLYCHFIVSALPGSAIPELADELDDLSRRYLKPATKTQPTLTNSTRLRAKLGKAVARPEIQLDGE
jgi:hypothetical protein